MHFYIAQDADQLAEKAARFILDSGFLRNGASLGLASGSTPKKTYAAFAKMVEDSNINLLNLNCFHLDEYAGMFSQDPRSFVAYFQQNIVAPLHLKPDQITFWKGDAVDPDKECQRYQRTLHEKGGIDCQILGLGINGHIGFNEPGSLKESRCRLVKLTEETLQHNAKDLQGGLMPTHALTMGIADILEAKAILLLVSGKNKTESLRRFLEEKENPAYPASFLKSHRNLTVIADEDAVDGVVIPAKAGIQNI